MELNKNVVVITGASKGFGAALARSLIREGAEVIIASNDVRELQKAAKELGCDYFVADVRAAENLSKLALYVVEKFGRIDIWINNAGIQIAPSPLEDISIEKLQNLFAINFFGYFYGCMAALRVMKKQGGGVILNVNSTAGLTGKPGLGAYSSSKFAVKGLSEVLREELKGATIQVYEVFPGGMQTDIYHEKVPTDFEAYMTVDYTVEKVMENLKQLQPDPDLIIRRPQQQ